ncbi:LYR motif-containing protein At3g19508, partial [Linum grandiflorum]
KPRAHISPADVGLGPEHSGPFPANFISEVNQGGRGIARQSGIRLPESEMRKALRIYGEVLRLVRRLPKDSRLYYAKYARENFVNYRELDEDTSLDELFQRSYNHSLWVLSKYSVDKSAAMKLKDICFE